MTPNSSTRHIKQFPDAFTRSSVHPHRGIETTGAHSVPSPNSAHADTPRLPRKPNSAKVVNGLCAASRVDSIPGLRECSWNCGSKSTGLRRTFNVCGSQVTQAVAHSTEYDVHIKAHNGIQGTSRPVCYTMLKVDDKVTANTIQSVTYSRTARRSRERSRKPGRGRQGARHSTQAAPFDETEESRDSAMYVKQLQGREGIGKLLGVVPREGNKSAGDNMQNVRTVCAYGMASLP